MFFLATADKLGQTNCNYKGGEPGFVQVIDERTVAFPSYDGNGMYLSAGNMLVNPNVGMLFTSFEHQHRLKLNGVATIAKRDELLAKFPKAQFVVRVQTRQVFPNCKRYIHRYRLEERSRFGPRAHEDPPVPDWKREEYFRDALAANDPARDPSRPSAPAAPRRP